MTVHVKHSDISCHVAELLNQLKWKNKLYFTKENPMESHMETPACVIFVIYMYVEY